MAKYKTTVTHLEMMPPFLPATPDAGWPDGISFTREMDISVAAYRALYDQVGRQWHWVNRRMLTDRQLSAIIHHPATEIFTLKNRDRAIGFVELNFKLFPQVEIVFVGLIKDAIGRGLGSAMLERVIDYIYTRAPSRIIIQTCTLDHPSALPLYQRRGFTPVGRKQVTIIDDER
jgi:GNAT superfamily N-acetyltransferase|tara:strand:- start:41 stop:562 length:522 start_codon:yes stop_codon:yes gene_type:complete